jgi:hypothetical protein
MAASPLLGGSVRVISQIPWLVTASPTEYTAVGNGGVYEHRETVEFDANLALLDKRDKIDARWTSLNNIIPNRIRERYKFWGLDRDVS